MTPNYATDSKGNITSGATNKGNWSDWSHEEKEIFCLVNIDCGDDYVEKMCANWLKALGK